VHDYQPIAAFHPNCTQLHPGVYSKILVIKMVHVFKVHATF